MLALATPDPRTRPTVYHAFRTAERLHAPFDGLWVHADDRDVTDGDKEVTALKRLVSTLGGNLLVRQGEDLVEITAQAARERRSTYLLMGRPRRRRNSFGLLAHRRLSLVPGRFADAG